MELTKEELDLARQWFDAVQGLNSAYLDQKDRDLAKKIYHALGMRFSDRDAGTPPKWPSQG